MKVLRILLLALIVTFAGCASISYTPETGKITYFRIGDQQIDGFKVIKSGDSITVKLESQKTEGKALTDALGIIGALAIP